MTPRYSTMKEEAENGHFTKNTQRELEGLIDLYIGLEEQNNVPKS